MKPSVTGDLVRLIGDRKILVVDDERFSRSIVCKLLSDIGAPKVIAAGDAGEGLGLLAADSEGFAAAICDFNMPVLTGLHFLKAVRTGIEGLRNTLPVIMLTGFSDAALVGSALDLDVDGFVVKPVARPTLEARLRRALTGGGPEVKAPAAYGRIDVDEVSRQVLMGTAPAPVPIPKAKAEAPAGPGRAVAIEEAPEGAELARDVVAVSGEVLVQKGVPMSARLASRLKELADMKIVAPVVYIL